MQALLEIPSMRGTLVGQDSRWFMRHTGHMHLRHISALHFAHGRIWLAVQRNTQQDRAWKPSLLCFDPTAQCFVDITARIGELSPVTALAADHQSLWLATGSEGAVRVDPDGLSAARFGPEEGLITASLSAAVQVGERVYFSGDAAKLSAYDVATQKVSDVNPGGVMVHEGGVTRPMESFKGRPMAAAGPWLMYGGPMANVYNIQTRENLSIAAELHRLLGPRGHGGMAWSAHSYVGDGVGGCFWMVCGNDLVRYNPVARHAQRWPVPLPDQTRVILADGDFVWCVARQEGKEPTGQARTDDHLLLWHAPSRKFVGRRQLRGNLTAAASSDRHLWLALEPTVEFDVFWDDRPVLWSLEKTAAYGAVDSQWAPATGTDDRFILDGVWEPSGSTPLMRAAWDSDADRVRRLIASGAEVEAQSAAGYRALMPAILSGNPDVVEQLLGRGARTLNHEWRGIPMLLGLAARHGHPKIARRLIEIDAAVELDRHMLHFTSYMGGGYAWANHPPLHSAAEGGDVELAGLLLERGAEVDMQADFDVQTPCASRR